MDGLTHPVGEEPSNVYWKRRLAVVAAIVVVGLLVWWLLSSLGGGSGTPATTPDPGASISTSPSESPGSTAAADPGRPCTGADYTVATVVPAEVSGSKKVNFTVTVTSKGDSPCVIDPTKESKLTVRSGSDAWFDSSDCPASFALFDAEAFVIEAGKTHDLKTSWNYGRDDKGCVADLQDAKSGTYKATVTVAGVKADEASFHVS